MGPTETTWVMFECEKGCRWSEVRQLRNDPEVRTVTADGAACTFSGCTSDHKVRRVRESTSGDEVFNWFKDIHEEEG